MQHPFQSFRAARWLRSTNLLLQAILLITLFAGLNYLARYNSWRFDLTQLRRHSLSAETHAYLKNLGSGRPVGQPLQIRLINTFPQDGAAAGPDALPDLVQINNDITALLREYTYALETNSNARLQIENIDVYQRPRDAGQLNLQPNRLILISGAPPNERRRELTLDDLYQKKNNQRVALTAEQAITAAILSIANPNPEKIYFLTGHGEMDLNSIDNARGLSELRDALRARNYALDTLDLTRTTAIPDTPDTAPALLISIGAQTRYEPNEQELLRRYMTDRAGRLILCATPATNPTGLEDLLAEWGILLDNARVYDRATATQATYYGGDLILSTFTPHDVTNVLIDNQLVLRFGDTPPARPHPARHTDPGLSVTPLVITATTAWGEHDTQRTRTPRYDPAVDLPGPLPVVTVAERAAAKNDLQFSVRVGRIIAFGNSDFVANGRLRAGANNTLIFSAINWLVERGASLNIPARPVEKFQLALTRDQLTRLRYTLLFGVPAIFALIGLFVYWTRRR